MTWHIERFSKTMASSEGFSLPLPLERPHALIWESLGPLPDHPRIIEMIQNIRLLDSQNIILPAESGIRTGNQLSRRLL